MRSRMVVAGFGNVLRGDDGFGVEVVRRLQQSGAVPYGTALLEVGIGGIALAQELLTPCDRLVIVDSMERGGTPGSVYVLRVDDVERPRSIDMHMAVPARALGLALALGVLPREVFLVGCEPAAVDDLTMEMSDPVKTAIDSALQYVQTLLSRPFGSRAASLAQGRSHG
ncbi:MAG: hydrogenase maturation protease [Acidobacteria bacterium]|nr:hydrogenase maturation protease [Acidobacteriota bacterium]